MKVILAQPRGFCAGVHRAIQSVERALERFGSPVYVYHEIVHNQHVVDDLRRKGAVFVDTVDVVPQGAVLLFSAHGVPPTVRERAAQRGLATIDATCPLVTKVHVETRRFASRGYTIILIGNPDHVEVNGTRGEAPDQTVVVRTVDQAEAVQAPDPDKVAYLTQTTLSVDETAEVVAVLRRRFPRIHAPSHDDICYATQNRQNAVKQLARQADLVLVVGDAISSNSKQLPKVAQAQGTRAHLISTAEEIVPEWLANVRTVVVTAGASAPEWLVEEVVAMLRRHGADEVREVCTAQESTRFPIPRELRD
jgi:4-hydroxy-3-methylbut-2-en-1-yl diphosphate reductase